MIDTYPQLTNAQSHEELIRWWISQKPISTQKMYLMVSRQFLAFAGKNLKEVMLEDILLWLESYNLRQASQNTINNKLAVIKSLFSFAVKTGYLQANPAALVKSSLSKDALNEKILDEDEVRALIQGAKNERDRLIIVLLYVLGLRVSELVALNWEDFKPTKKGVLVTIFGKGSKTRTLVLESELFDELLKLPKGSQTEAVFLSRFGNRLDRHAIHRLVKAAAERAGINQMTSAHWLRHAHATHSLNHGAGIHLLMKSLGHSSLSTTSRYLHCQVGECTSQFIDLS